MSSIFRITGVN